MLKYLPPASDVIFKAFFGDRNHSEFVLSFLKSFLECPDDEFVGVEFVDPLMSKQNQMGKYSYLDLLLKTKSGHKVNVEMQNSDLPGLEKRIAYYLSRLCSIQLNESEDYSLLNRTIVIFILNYRMKPEKFNNLFAYFEDCLPKVPRIYTSNLFFDWLTFIKSKTEEEFEMVAKKNPELKRAVARLARISSDQATQILYDYQLKKTMDERVLQKTAREEGIKEGIKEGEIKKAIEDVVNLVSATKMSINEAMKILKIDFSYKDQIKEELERQGIKYQE